MKMDGFELELLDDEVEDEETIEELKKSNKEKNKNFSAVINKKKLSKYELDEIMF